MATRIQSNARMHREVVGRRQSVGPMRPRHHAPTPITCPCPSSPSRAPHRLCLRRAALAPGTSRGAQPPHPPQPSHIWNARLMDHVDRRRRTRRAPSRRASARRDRSAYASDRCGRQTTFNGGSASAGARWSSPKLAAARWSCRQTGVASSRGRCRARRRHSSAARSRSRCSSRPRLCALPVPHARTVPSPCPHAVLPPSLPTAFTPAARVHRRAAEVCSRGAT